MDFEFSPFQKSIQKLCREFAQREIAPIASRIDETGEFPMETVKKMGKLGLLGLQVPKEYGGVGIDTLAYVLAVEEISRVCASHGAILSGLNSLVNHGIYLFGTEQQKKKYLPALCTGEKLGAFSLTEPEAGSDPASMKTRAVKRNSEYILHGRKSWVTIGPVADVFVLFALTDPEKKHRGITAFLVDADTPGLEKGKVEPKLGIRATATCELLLNDCHVPEENRLGQEGEGFKIAMSILDSARIGIAAQAVGIAQAAFETSLEYARVREAFGKKIGEFQAIQWMLVDMHTAIQSARLLTWYAAYRKDKNLPYITESATAKLCASETAMWVTTKAIQIHGAIGYSKEYPLERYFRDAKVTEIYEGTSEIQRLLIARQILK
ncbi:MAG: acyl-CoA dehydrogenase [bacterium JZ-2024 1]